MGYKTLVDWYRDNYLMQRLKYITTPTLLMYMEDDPVVPLKLVEKKKILENKNLIYAEFKNGGHIAMFTGLKPELGYYKPIIEFINAL